MIDIHTHAGEIANQLGIKDFMWSKKGASLTLDDLLAWMDINNIDKSCIMATENPEELLCYVSSQDLIAKCANHPHHDRFIPFCSVDPRIGHNRVDFAKIISGYVACGARGFGEIIVELLITDSRLMEIYAACGACGIPVLIHMSYMFGKDQIGLPGLRQALRMCPKTNFILHATHWWAEISGNVNIDECMSSKVAGKSPLTKPGSVQRTLSEFPNVFADISAKSGHNALMRFADNGCEFLETYQDKILFGTDYMFKGQSCPQLEYIKTVPISEKAYRKITHTNAAHLLNLE